MAHFIIYLDHTDGYTSLEGRAANIFLAEYSLCCEDEITHIELAGWYKYQLFLRDAISMEEREACACSFTNFEDHKLISGILNEM